MEDAMKVVIFGGSGFLGSHVADVMTERGDDVTIYDRAPSPYATPAQRMIVGDMLDGAAVRQAVESCDYVYHFAGLADLDDATTKPVETVKQNVLATTMLLEASVQAGVKRFVYASTIYVYGDLGGFYRCSKQAGELYIEEYQRRYGLDYTVLRYGTLYGPRADRRNSVWSYLQQALTEGKILYPGTGEETREYVHVRDAAQLSVEILGEEFRNQHVIVTGHHRMKAADMLNMIREILKDQVRIEFAGAVDEAHYSLTPYAFIPKLGKKLVSNCYVDMGQGLLECLQEMARMGVTARPSTGGAVAPLAHSGRAPRSKRRDTRSRVRL
jgi:UDP-glucose 4-epimerase